MSTLTLNRLFNNYLHIARPGFYLRVPGVQNKTFPQILIISAYLSYCFLIFLSFLFSTWTTHPSRKVMTAPVSQKTKPSTKYSQKNVGILTISPEFDVFNSTALFRHSEGTWSRFILLPYTYVQ